MYFCCARCNKKTINSLKYFVSIPISGDGCNKYKIVDGVCLYCCFILTEYYRDCIFF